MTHTSRSADDAIGAFFAANADAPAPRRPRERARPRARHRGRLPERLDDPPPPPRRHARRARPRLADRSSRPARHGGSTADARETPSGSLHTSTPDDDSELPEPARPRTPAAPKQLALARIEHDERVEALKALKPREREALYLHGLGHSYHEIAKLTDSTYTAVNRRITEGHAALRHERPHAAAAIRSGRGRARHPPTLLTDQ